MSGVVDRMSGFELAALCLGEALGGLVEAAQPMWVAALLKDGTFSTTQVGWLASSELFSIATGAVVASIVRSRGAPLRTVGWAASLVAIANAIAMFTSPWALVIGRLLSGVGTGVVLARVIGLAARRTNATRVLAMMQLPAMLLGSLLYVTSPLLAATYGPAGIFSILVVLAGVEVILAALAGPGFSAPVQSRSPSPVHWLAGALGCLAIISVNAAFTVIWTYIVLIGKGLGFSTGTVGNVLAVAAPVGLMAPLTASILGERLGLIRPITCSLLLMGSIVFFLVRAPSPLLFGACAAVFILGAAFYNPYATTLLARVDRTGRLPSAAPVLFMIGGAVGPSLGSHLIGRSALPGGAASLVALGIVLFGAAFILTSRSAAPSLHARA
jgi:MFS transporter